MTDAPATQPTVDVWTGDARHCLASMPAGSVHCAVTSPPYYGLRDYGHAGQLGLEPTLGEYVAGLVNVFRELRRVLRDDGTLWLNLGDSYGAGSRTTQTGQTKHDGGTYGVPERGRVTGFAKNLLGVPWRVAFALQEDGWYLRQDVIWHKPNPMPESTRDRCTKAHEYLFLLSKSPRYYFDNVAIAEPATAAAGTNKKYAGSGSEKHRTAAGLAHVEAVETRNRRSVWTVAPTPYKGAHFAVMPQGLIAPCIQAGTSERGVCAACGTPWNRETQKTRIATRPGANTKVTGDAMTDGNRDPERHVTRTVTVGWNPGCGCGAPTIPATVLDPFGGSGTTAEVAFRMGRSSVLVELNPEYVNLISERVAAL